jgi:hypothetical protein
MPERLSLCLVWDHPEVSCSRDGHGVIFAVLGNGDGRLGLSNRASDWLRDERLCCVAASSLVVLQS